MASLSSFRRMDRPVTTSVPKQYDISSSIPTVPPRAPGTKPWINGNTLISSGNRDLDSVLGGGICLGTVTLVEEDRFSDHALVLSKYFLAQGVSGMHQCLVIGAEGSKAALQKTFVVQLPFDLTYKKNQQEQQEREGRPCTQGSDPSSALPTRPLSTFSRELGDSLPSVGGPRHDPLSIAWQYRKYINTPTPPPRGSASTAPASSSFCNSYDLSRDIQPEVLAAAAPPVVVDVSEEEEGQQEPSSACSRVYQSVASAIKSLPENTVLRVVIKSFLTKTGAWASAHEGEPLLLLHSLRRLIRHHPVAIFVTLSAHHVSQRQRRLLARVADTVLELQSFAGHRHRTAPEFEAFAGFLHIKALQHLNALAPIRGPSNKLGVKRDRRKLHIEPLHLPPEGVRNLTEDVEMQKRGRRRKEERGGGPGGEGKTGGLVPGMMCATSGRGGHGASLDF